MFFLYMSHLMTKSTKWLCAQQRLKTSLGIRPVWSESLLCTQWVAKDPSFLHADSKDSSDWADAQADLSLCWAHMQFCWFCHAAAHIMYFCIDWLEGKYFFFTKHVTCTNFVIKWAAKTVEIGWEIKKKLISFAKIIFESGFTKLKNCEVELYRF